MPETRWLIVTPQQLAIEVFLPDRSVVVRFQLDHETTGFLKGTELAIRMSPNEARQLAFQLNSKALAAEAL